MSGTDSHTANETPRTDALYQPKKKWLGEKFIYVYSTSITMDDMFLHARQLERELAEVKAQRAEERRSEVNVFERLNRRGIAMPIGLRSRLQEWTENLRPESKHADDAFFLIFLLNELLPPSDGTTSPHGPHD